MPCNYSTKCLGDNQMRQYINSIFTMQSKRRNSKCRCHWNEYIIVLMPIAWLVVMPYVLGWCHYNDVIIIRDGVSNQQLSDCLLNRLFRRRSKKASKLRVTALCEENSLVTGELPAQRSSNTEKVSIWWRHDMEVWIPFSKFTKLIQRLLNPLWSQG